MLGMDEIGQVWMDRFVGEVLSKDKMEHALENEDPVLNQFD